VRQGELHAALTTTFEERKAALLALDGAALWSVRKNASE
jgi:hypothetical protein